jgi:MipA family protein
MTALRWALAAFALSAAFAAAPAARADDLPLWEAGAGVAAIDFPDYRGSDERTTYLLPFPYLVYRGEFLKADRDRVRGLFFRSERSELNISISGSVPVDSSENAARRGMPDLDPTAEIGPNLELTLYRDAGETLRLDLRLPVRAVIATDFSRVYDVGWVFQPQLNLDLRDTPLGRDWKVGLAAGPLFGDRRYHGYYYGVEPQYANAARHAYEAPGGYGGVQAIAAVSRRFPGYWFGAFARWDTLRGAAFETSPLVRQQESFSVGFALAWMLGESARRVPADR